MAEDAQCLWQQAVGPVAKIVDEAERYIAVGKQAIAVGAAYRSECLASQVGHGGGVVDFHHGKGSFSQML